MLTFFSVIYDYIKLTHLFNWLQIIDFVLNILLFFYYFYFHQLNVLLLYLLWNIYIYFASHFYVSCKL